MLQIAALCRGDFFASGEASPLSPTPLPQGERGLKLREFKLHVQLQLQLQL